jgi:putative transposase
MPRHQAAGAVYHVCTRAARDGELYLDEIDYQLFLLIVGKTLKKLHWICRAYCLMPNHYHFLFETPEADLALGMHLINGQYAKTFNRRHGAQGHLLQSRYRSVLVQTEEHFLTEHRYIALNPVKARLVRRPEDWPWSSYGVIFGRTACPPFFDPAAALLGFDDDGGDPRERLWSFIEDGARELPIAV